MAEQVQQVVPTGTLKQLDVDSILFDNRFREEFGDLETLAESVREKGILQPITVSPDMRLLAGERRLRAAKMAGLKKIPALVRKIDGEVDAREIELIENTFRKNFTWAEESAIVQQIDKLYKEKDYDWSNRKTAQLLDKGTASVSRALQLARAVELMPELANLKTADEAFKVVKAMEEQQITTELARRQTAAVSTGNMDRTVADMLKIANGNYRIGDTFKGLAELRNEGVIHIIECDPPYGIDLTDQKMSKENAAAPIHTYNEIPRDEYAAFLPRLAKELYRVAGKNCWLVFWFGPTWQREVLVALREAGWLVDEIPAVWTKKQGQTLQPELYFGRAYEPFYLARKGQPVMAKRGRLNVFQYDTVPGGSKYHPTQRPVHLIQDILETLGVPRQIVLCPFLGSGTTLRAAYNAGMSGMGWDMSSEYKDKFMLLVEADTKNLAKEDVKEDE